MKVIEYGRVSTDKQQQKNKKKRNKLTTEIFIAESTEIHKGKYDYSQSVYKGWDNQIAIICPIHGLFYQKAGAHIKGKGCKKCADCERGHFKRLSTNEFIEKSNEIHGNKYDYSKVVYETQYSKVRIICPIHGEFIQKAGNHLNGKGCKKCASEQLKRKIFGVGINDYKCGDGNSYNSKCYITWRTMLYRCYSKYYVSKYPTYNNCKVCDEWLSLSNFKKWFDENYIEGYAIDKDLTQHGLSHKIYSPSTCVFVPERINTMFTKCDSNRGKIKIGVRKQGDLFISEVSKMNEKTYIGCFKTENEAFQAYKREKEKYIKEVADDYFTKGLITERVRDLMYKYEVLEND